jgi:hypothetical protein
MDSGDKTTNKGAAYKYMAMQVFFEFPPRETMMLTRIRMRNCAKGPTVTVLEPSFELLVGNYNARILARLDMRNSGKR